MYELLDIESDITTSATPAAGIVRRGLLRPGLIGATSLLLALGSSPVSCSNPYLTHAQHQTPGELNPALSISTSSLLSDELFVPNAES